MCLMSSCKGIDIWLEIGEFQAQVSTHFQMGFQSSYLIPEFIDPHSTLSLYRPLRASHRPKGVDIDHFGYP
ncbi:hypothetical protein T08_9948 [Trichinella sp. T8]|nr:hypothetical protein T08_9948 [Trichinella sp. T8]